MLKNIAIIPARGGSKRIPKKNIKLFLGQPVIKYSIDAALSSGCFDEVMVSTEDEEIASLSISFGAKVPFMRSEKAADDYTTTAEVLLEVLRDYLKLGSAYKYACCIYPVAPFCTADRLKKGLSLLTESAADSVIPVTPFSYPIQRALKIEKQKLKPIYESNLHKRTQDFEPAYHDAGQFYWFNVSRFINRSGIRNSIISENTVPLVLSALEVQDIDNEDDWKIAEMKYTYINNCKIMHGNICQ